VLAKADTRMLASTCFGSGDLHRTRQTGLVYLLKDKQISHAPSLAM